MQLAHEAQHAATNLARALATLTTEKAQQIAALAKLDPDFPEL
ncbi:hypothetical protein JCM19240_3975 [Vibrio maritimus]|uniref:Uncharacterized protein n=1 Tax=Vibrio maritimus TaxID=990268 RepID=A0A090THQ0_9VIBR|nr:hypothetical protein JCM19240_3975 [Vibrio maritimus]